MFPKLLENLNSFASRLAKASLIQRCASRRGVVTLFLLFYTICTLGILARYEFNPSALVRFGHYYVEQNQDITPEGAIRLTGNEAHGGNGYDGQIFYYYARTLFQPDVWPAGFSLAYRAPRAGYPLLAAPFAVLGDWGVVFGLYFAQIALMLASLVCIHALLPVDRKWAAIFYALSPFAFMAFSLLVSDSIMIGLAFVGYYFYLRSDPERHSSEPGVVASFAQPGARAAALVFAGLCFSMAIFAKESALFFLFPLGLHALWRRRIGRAAFMIAILAPVFAWQLYLREAHGMVPAEVLSIFLAPLDGVFGVARETLRLLGAFIEQPGGAALVALIKHGAKILLVAVLAAGIALPFTGAWRKQSFVPLRLGILLTALHIIIADWFYFWGIFDNVGRMFTMFVPLVVLLKGEDRSAKTAPFFFFVGVLSAFILVRAVFLTPAFDYDVFTPYQGPDYEQAPVGPGGG
ncbi:MAG: hypothetical protein NXI24_14185 [bacterium]|nr:hypothetical protein [bacterium]